MTGDNAGTLPTLRKVVYSSLRMSTTGQRFERAVAIMQRLRAPGGCPWDREQTFDSIKPYTLEETYEVLEAIDNRDWDELPGELGDLLLQVLFYSEMAKEQGTFSIDDVLDRLSGKLVDRHPHVFGDDKADTSGEVKRNWEALKMEERKKRRSSETKTEAASGSAADFDQVNKDTTLPNNDGSILASISSKMPAMLEASKLSARAAQIGFDWPEMEGLFEKLAEETAELRERLEEFPAPGPRPEGRGIAGSGRQIIAEDLRERLEEEVGDLLFAAVNVARFVGTDPEIALKHANRKFLRRFQWMESAAQAEGKKFADLPRERMEALWDLSKRHPDELKSAKAQ